MGDDARSAQLVERLDTILTREADGLFSRALNAAGPFRSPGVAADAWTALADLLREAVDCAAQLAALSRAQRGQGGSDVRR